MRFGLVGPSYSSQSLNADCEELINAYVETVEAEGGKSRAALYPTPGLKARWALELPVRGLFYQNGRLFAAAKGTLWELFADYTKVGRGDIEDDHNPVSWAAGQTQILIGSAGRLYVFDLGLNTLVKLADPVGVAQVEYLHGFFLALLGNSNKLRFSGLEDATAWDPLDIFEVSLFPDNVLALIADHNEVWLMGRKRSVPYYDSGDADNPLQPVTQGIIEQGIYPPRAFSRFDNSFAWLGGDERGNMVAWRMQGYQPVRISNHAVESIWSHYRRTDDAVSYAYQDQGHTFWVIVFPSADTHGATWVYDAATGMWHRRGWWDTTSGSYWAHRSWVHAFAFGRHLVGDWASGKVYEMRIPEPDGAGGWNFADDDGSPIRRLRRSPVISNEGERIFIPRVEIDMETGLGPIPPLPGDPLPGVASFILADAGGQLWEVTVDTNGVVHTAQVSSGIAAPLFVGDPIATFQVTVDALGLLHTTEVAFSPAAELVQAMLDSVGNAWLLGEALNGVLQTTGPAFSPRAPQLMLRFSKDSGHTWSNEYRVDCGKAGEYTARAVFRRLGSAYRGFVIEISWSDPVPFRVIDGYIPPATERLAEQMRRGA